MVERKGPAKGKFGGGFSGPRAGGAGGARGGYKAGGSREGGFDRKPREGGYDRKPREGGERSYAPRADGERKPYVKREGGFDRKPREGGYERKSFGDGERKPYVKREGSSYERKPREGGERSYAPRGDGERRPYTPREGGYDRKPREGGYERKSFGDGERKPYVKREGGFDRKPREGGYERKSFGDGERKPYVKREGGFDRAPRENRGEGKPANFSEKRTIKRDRSTPDEKLLMGGDGWLVGYHAVLAALTAGRRKVRKVWLLSEAQGELATLLEKHSDWDVEIKSKPEFEREFGDVVHQGVAALVGNLPQPSLPELLSSKPKLIIALDQITDPHNLGAIVRSAAAFGAAGVLVTEHRAAGLNLTAAKVAAGAMEVVPVVEVTNLVQSLTMMQEAGYTVLGMAGEAETEIGDVNAKGPVCLVMGSEGEGLRRLTRETCDTLVKIQISAAMESLNVSVATGVALSILTRK